MIFVGLLVIYDCFNQKKKTNKQKKLQSGRLKGFTLVVLKYLKLQSIKYQVLQVVTSFEALISDLFRAYIKVTLHFGGFRRSRLEEAGRSLSILITTEVQSLVPHPAFQLPLVGSPSLWTAPSLSSNCLWERSFSPRHRCGCKMRFQCVYHPQQLVEALPILD